MNVNYTLELLFDIYGVNVIINFLVYVDFMLVIVVKLLQTNKKIVKWQMGPLFSEVWANIFFNIHQNILSIP